MAILVSEMIGRTSVSAYNRFLLMPTQPTTDGTRPDYVFWSQFRRGKQPGYELGSLFAKRICEIDAEWTLGRGFTVSTGSEAADALAAELIADHLDTLMTWRKDSSALGDSYIVVNPDGSLMLASPDTVEVLTDELTGQEVVGYRMVTQSEKAKVTDEYRLSTRTVSIEFFDPNMQTQLPDGQTVQTDQGDGTLIEQNRRTWRMMFPNLIGMLPVIHLPNDRESNEIYGHPVYEALLRLFARYDDVLQKSLDGVEIMGRPIPVVEGAKNAEQVRSDNATTYDTVQNQDGSYEQVPVINFDDVDMLIFGEGVTFRFAQPGSFSADSVAMLKKLFYLMLEHTGIPEWAWGGAIASSKASVDSQMPAFIRYLEGRRTQTQNAVRKLVEVWLAYKRLVTFVPAVERVLIEWPALEGGDEELQFKKVEYAKNSGLLTSETALRILDLVEDPAAEIKAADAEAEANKEAFDRALEDEMKKLPASDDEESEDVEETEDNG